MKPRSALSLASSSLCAAVLSAGVALAGGGSSYTYVDLGTLGGPESVAYGLNDARQVVGWSHIQGCDLDGVPCRRAYVWQNGVMTNLGLLAGDEESFARAINESGLVVGTSESDIVFGSGTFHAFSWSGGVMTPLPTLGQDVSFAHDVNDAGVIAGHTQNASFLDRAVTWQNGVIDEIGATETHSRNRAYGVSEAGRVVGFAWELFQPNDAILLDGAWVTIGGFGQFQNAEAYDVNDAGQVVGLQAFPSGSWHAAVWDEQQGAIDAGVLPLTDFEYGELYDVNESGVAVGRSYTGTVPQQSRAVIWDGNALLDLNDFLPAGFNGVLWEAREINELGDIAGTAVVDGKFRAFLMVDDASIDSWQDLGQALPGAGGAPLLVGQGTLIGGTPANLHLSNALPGAPSFMILGFSLGNIPVPFGTLVPSPDFLVGPLFVDGAGEHDLPLTWVTGLPAGISTYWQQWIVDPSGPAGLTASNGVRGTTP